MSTTRVVRCKSTEDFVRKCTRDMKRLRQRVNNAVWQTARESVVIIRDNTPKAFGELRDSIHAEDRLTGVYATVVGAPHAAAVEIGSRPHVVPLEDLIRWVKLRGMQGLDRSGRLKGVEHNWSRFAKGSSIGTTTERHARSIAGQIRSTQRNGATPIDAPEQIARAIQAAIAKAGTKPQHYVAKSIDKIVDRLNTKIQRAVK